MRQRRAEISQSSGSWEAEARSGLVARSARPLSSAAAANSKHHRNITMKTVFALLLALVASAAAFTGTPLQLTRSSSAAVRSNARSTLVMRERACDLLGKTANRKARVVTFSHKRIHKVQQVNLQWKRFYSDDLGRQVRLRLSTKGIKTVNKYGSIDAAAKKFGIDLGKF